MNIIPNPAAVSVRGHPPLCVATFQFERDQVFLLVHVKIAGRSPRGVRQAFLRAVGQAIQNANIEEPVAAELLRALPKPVDA
jgi:hypothetical protein